MEPDDEKQTKGALNATIEKGKDLKDKADKTKKKIKIFMKLPTPVKIAIIAAPLVVIGLALLLGGAAYLLDILNWESIFTSKASAMGAGTTYSTQVVQMDNGKWKFEMSNELKQKIEDAGIDTNGMTQDEMLVQLLIANGLDIRDFTDEELDLLPYLIKAELSTQQLDLRSALDMYKSDGTYNPPDTTNSLNSDELCGTVHLKRVNSKDSTNSTILSYVDYNTFKSYSNDKDNAIKYFSFNDAGDLVIYTWNYTKIEVKTLGTKPEHVTVDDDLEDYSLQEIIVDYKSLINKYTLPVEVLTALLINSEDIEFTKAIANLGMESNIEIGIMEEYSYSETTDIIKYSETVRKYKYLNGTLSAYGKTQLSYDNKLIGKLEEGSAEDVECEHDGKHGTKFTEKIVNFTADTPTFTITQVTKTETNTYKYGILMADTWFLKAKKDYTIETKNESSSNSGSYIDTYYIDTYKYSKDSTKKTGDSIDIPEVKNKIQEIKDKVSKVPLVMAMGELQVSINFSNKIASVKYSGITFPVNAYATTIPGQPSTITVIDTNGTEFYYSLVKTTDPLASSMYKPTGNNVKMANNITETIDIYKKADSTTDTTTTTTTYEVKDGTVRSDIYEDKTEKFLKAYDESNKAKGNIGSTPGWLEEMLDEYDPNFTLMIEYLLAKYYGREDVDISSIVDIYNLDDFTSFSSGTGSGWWWPIGSTLTEEIDGKTYANGKPFSSYVNSKFGERWGKQHKGIDITGGNIKGKNVIASRDGIVTEVKDGYGDGYLGNTSAGYGNVIKIKHEDGTMTVYGHLLKGTLNVKAGDTVKQGQVIAQVGTSGNSSGPHLHFEIRDANGNAVNPEEYVDLNNPRPVAISASSLRDWLWQIEGGTQYIKGTTWIVFDPAGSGDNTMNLAHGMVIASKNGGDSWYPSVIPGTIHVGQTVTESQANKIWELKIKCFCDAIDSACAKNNVTLNTNQRDALISCVYRLGTGKGQATALVKAYKNGGNAGLWSEMKNRYNRSYPQGTKNRLAEEYELFVKGDYKYEYNKTAKYNKFCENPNI